jgi:hypothetical protein
MNITDKFIEQNRTSVNDIILLSKLIKFETELKFRKRLKSNQITSNEENDEQIELLETFINSKLDNIS